MEISTVNDKGQITIPSAIRKQMNLANGSKLRLFLEPDHSTLVLSPSGSIASAFGMLPKPDRPRSLEELAEAAGEAAVEEATSYARD